MFSLYNVFFNSFCFYLLHQFLDIDYCFAFFLLFFWGGGLKKNIHHKKYIKKYNHHSEPITQKKITLLLHKTTLFHSKPSFCCLCRQSDFCLFEYGKLVQRKSNGIFPYCKNVIRRRARIDVLTVMVPIWS